MGFMSKERILKVQLPVMTNADRPMGLAYAKNRKVMIEFPADAEAYKSLGGELKSFWYGRIVKGQLHLDRKAPWQEW